LAGTLPLSLTACLRLLLTALILAGLSGLVAFALFTIR
jgi:hypothetical protein